MSFYAAATKKPGYLIYATPYEYKVFSTDESSALTAETRESCMNDFYRTALTRQNLIKLSDDAEYVAKNFIQPDFKNINYFGYSDAELDEVKKILWSIKYKCLTRKEKPKELKFQAECRERLNKNLKQNGYGCTYRR